MGMSTSVVGFKPPDGRWRQMKAVWDACEAAEVPPPADVEAFFEGAAPDPAGVAVGQRELEKCGAVAEWSDEGASGYEVDVTKLPPGVKIVRVYNSW